MKSIIDKYLKQIHGAVWKKGFFQKPLRKKEYDKRYNISLRRWLLYHQEKVVFHKVRWMGVPMFKNVLDAWIYQEIVYEVSPDVVIEIGSKYGGSTKYFANLLDLLGKGIVISIDIDRSLYKLNHNRVKIFTGSSSEPEIISEVAKLCENKKVLVVQDGDHKKKQVLEDLNNYSRFVSTGSYFIVEDGIVDLFHHGDGLGFKDKGPLSAVEEFLKQNTHFAVDSMQERYLLTYNPKGFLKRII